MQDITAWLQGNRPYHEGVALYTANGGDPLLHLLFKEDYSAYKQTKLEEVLAELVAPGDDAGSGVQVCDATNGETCITDNYTCEQNTKSDFVMKAWPTEMDATVKALYDEWLPLFKERKDLQARITDVALMGEHDAEKEREAGAMAHRILDLRDACQAIYKKRSYYLCRGKLPEEPALPNLVTDPRKHPKCLANHSRYLRDYKAKLKAATDDKERERLATMVDMQQRYVDHYKQLLD